MKFTGICLVTDNVRGLVQFYSQILGCQAEGDDTHSEFALDGMGMAIFARQGMEEMAPGSMHGAGYGGVTIMLEVNNADTEYDRIKALGVDFIKLPATYPWGARSFWFRDPDGNIIDFYSRANS